MTRAWSDDMLPIIKAKWYTMPIKAIAEELGIGANTVYRALRRLGIKPPAMRHPTKKLYRRREWTMEEDEFLMAHYAHKDIDAIARKLRRTPVSIMHRANRIGASYSAPAHLLTRDEMALMLGLSDGALLSRRYTDARFVMPCIRRGRFVLFDEYEVTEWLKAGHILTFDRTKMATHLHRIYDGWKALTITSAEVFAECEPIGHALRRDKMGLECITIVPTNQMVYYKADVYAYAYRLGNRIPPWASARFKVIRQAWDTEFIIKADVIEQIGQRDFTYRIAPHLTTDEKFFAKRTEVCKALRRMGREDLVKRFTDVAIPWTEMMADYEKRSVK